MLIIGLYSRETRDIKKYVSLIKKNKIVVQGKVSVEPSTLYYYNGYYMRAYIKFKVNCAGNYKEDFIYGGAYFNNLKKNQWKTMYVDIEVGSATGGSLGDDFAVFNDDIY